MPGHKRNGKIINKSLPYDIDITEIDGFDDLHHATGIIEEAQKRAARIYHSSETHFLVNGSTAGIISAILGSTTRGDKILMCRNCHKSVYNAVVMGELEPLYLYPSFFEKSGIYAPIEVEMVKAVINENPDIKAVVIVSPTYDGVVSDIEGIAKVAHEAKIPLIVDEAHGAHFGFHLDFPKNSNQRGADLVIHSVHKTLPALTQTALLHINGELVNREKIRKYLGMLQSSSPSYVLLAGIDACITLLEKDGEERFQHFSTRREAIRERLRDLKHLQLVEVEEGDPSKILISTAKTNITGKQLFDRLLETYHLQFEMATPTYVLAITTIADTDEGFIRLAKALEEIDSSLSDGKSESGLKGLPKMKKIYTEAAVQDIIDKDIIKWEESHGRIALERAYLYPPGIPIIVPGEQISAEAIRVLEEYRNMEFEIQGLKEEGKIEVIADGEDILSDGEELDR